MRYEDDTELRAAYTDAFWRLLVGVAQMATPLILLLILWRVW